MLKTVTAIFGALALLAMPQLVSAQEASSAAQQDEAARLEQRALDVVRVFRDEGEYSQVFSSAFLAAVPPSQLDGMTTALTAQFGALVGLEKLTPSSATQAEIVLRFERALGTGQIVITPEAPHLIEGLLLQTFDPIDDSVEKITAELQALPGEVGVYFGPLDGIAPRLVLNPDKQMAIGSTFKVYVLSALTRKIQAGEANWDDVASISRRSYPSGMMQDWPEPAPVTLQTLATMMIAISDNTATDSLMEYLGQEAVVAEMKASGHSQPELNIPFIGTRHLFKLKASGGTLMDEYRAADVNGKYAILDELDETEFEEVDVQRAFASGPIALDLEWFASAHDLRRMMAHLPKGGYQTQLKIMAVNTSATDKAFERYGRIFYKGGSEPGVLNYTWLLKDMAGDYHVLAMSWNNPDANLDETAFELLGQRLLGLPHAPDPSKPIESVR